MPRRCDFYMHLAPGLPALRMNMPVLNSMPRITRLYISLLYLIGEGFMARSLCTKLGGFCFLSLLLPNTFGMDRVWRDLSIKEGLSQCRDQRL